MTRSQVFRKGRAQSLGDIRSRARAQTRGRVVKDSGQDPSKASVMDGEEEIERMEALDRLTSLKPASPDRAPRQRVQTGGSDASTDSTVTHSSTSSSSAPTLYDVHEEAVTKNVPDHVEVVLPAYKPLTNDPNGPGIATSYDFRNADPYCPAEYECQDYDHDAIWFDGRNEGDLRFTIDLEEGSTDRLPDIRPYLYYVGYWGHWEVEGAVAPPALQGLDRAGTEDLYVRMGRAYLRSERAKGRGYFLAKRDWPDLAKRNGPMAWKSLWTTPRTEEDVGLDDFHFGHIGLDAVTISTMKTNIRASMSDKRHVKVRPGDGDWDLYIQWLYSRHNHGIEQMIHDQCSMYEVYKLRRREGYEYGIFMIADEEAD